MSLKEFERVTQVVKMLRHPDKGCPWDLEQTHKTLLKYLIEESYEFVHATESDDYSLMEEEIGDVLLQVLLHSEIASEENHFNIESVSKVLADKLIRRHPHVFDNEENKKISTSEVKQNWEKIKSDEKNEKRYIDMEILHQPSLQSAQKIGVKTERVNFDWDNANQVIYKVEEEWQELKEELAPGVQPDRDKVKEELGDFLFSTVQLARHLGIDAESALRDANKKFIRRYQDMEDLMAKDDLVPGDIAQNEMDKYWAIAKQNEKTK